MHHARRRLQAASLALILAALVAGCTGGARPESVLSPGPRGVTDQPAPGYAEVRPGSEEDFIMNAGRRIYFSAGSAALDDVARETLDLQASWLASNPRWLLKLQGYADDPGNYPKNVSLSEKRASAVMDYLASKGVDPRRMWAKGYGKERPVRDCADISCKALNRRVVVNLRAEFDEAAPQFKNGRRLDG